MPVESCDNFYIENLQMWSINTGGMVIVML